MQKILHHLRRNRNYSSHERWGVFAGLLVLTLALTIGGWSFLGKSKASIPPLVVTKIDSPQDILTIGTESTGSVTLTVWNDRDEKVAVGAWIGLRVADPTLRTPEYTYYDWYSPSGNQAFFQTNDKGQVSFPLLSQKTGLIQYEIYAADPERTDDGKYQPLVGGFSVRFETPEEVKAQAERLSNS